MHRLGRLILVRHGESIWNITDKAMKRETRFTGWADISLSETGILQAKASGRCLAHLSLPIHAVFTSLLQRSRLTYKYLSEEMPSLYKYQEQPLPVVASWRLNERHYGALVGLSKSEAEIKLGREAVIGWRRSYKERPPPMEHPPITYSKSSDPNDNKPMFDWQSEIWSKAMTIKCNHLSDGKFDKEIISYDESAVIPKSESLEDTARRVLPLWKDDIFPRICAGENVLVVGHSNTIRSMVKHLDNLSDDSVREVVIPSAIPLIYTFALDHNQEVYSIGREHSRTRMKGRFIVTKELLELSLSASQNLEMSENLDETEEFKSLISETLNKVSQNRISGLGSLSSLQDPDQLAMNHHQTSMHGRIMESGWMTFSMKSSSENKQSN